MYRITACKSCDGTGWEDIERPDDELPEVICKKCDGFGHSIEKFKPTDFDTGFVSRILVERKIWFRCKSQAVKEMEKLNLVKR